MLCLSSSSLVAPPDLQALQIWAEFNDNYSLETFSLPRLGELYRQTQDEEILKAAAVSLGVEVEALRGWLKGSAEV